MIKSMTAFSQVSNTHDTITADVTIRSYNSRHLDMAFYSPESCQEFEDSIKKIIAKTHNRGRIEIRLSIKDEAKDQDLFEVDDSRARSYYQAVDKIKQDLNLLADISLDNILTARNIIVPLKKDQDSKKIWKAIEPCIEAASMNLNAMRKEEGKNLYEDLIVRIDYIEDKLKLVEKEADQIPMIYKQKLLEKISGLTSEIKELDPVRIAQEAAIIADKSDVSEEIVRLHSHIKLFRGSLDSKIPQGRKLNFLIQEFNREFNTIGSKAGNALLSHMVVDLKSQLEKIREQVQNIE
ncbi:MAG: YicC family protein [Desulfobacula sp.]|nr:YicC family protein [Desulfobacula sp.]